MSSPPSLVLWPKRVTHVAHTCVIVRASVARRVSQVTSFEMGLSRTVPRRHRCADIAP